MSPTIACGDKEPGMDELDEFLVRCSLPPGTRLQWDEFASRQYPHLKLVPCPVQGYCSYTLCAGLDTILQLRPRTHAIDVELAAAACSIYGELAPTTEFLGVLGGSDPSRTGGCTGAQRGSPGSPHPEAEADGTESPALHVYAMTRIPGTPLPAHLAAHHLDRRPLVRDLAAFYAQGWHHSSTTTTTLPRPKGRIGASLLPRLQALHAHLPARFRPLAAAALRALPRIEARLPWVLTHGDVVPANVMVDHRGLRLRGLLDWAEAEFLPFGVGLYGLEELLGRAVGGAGAASRRYPPPGSRFVYDSRAEGLRGVFWEELVGAVPELGGEGLRELVEAARRVGILLWHGIAFDDGRLDRVVEEGRDDEEIQRLDLFLLGDRGVDVVVPAHVPIPVRSGSDAGASGVLRRAWVSMQ